MLTWVKSLPRLPSESPPMTAGDWWPALPPRACIKDLQLVGTGWKTSVTVSNWAGTKLAGRSCLQPWPFITLCDSLLVSLPRPSPPSAHRRGTGGDFASARGPRAPEGQSHKGFCLDPALISHLGNQGTESLRNVLEVTEQVHGRGGTRASGLWPFYPLRPQAF